jgi:hypothetical protein
MAETLSPVTSSLIINILYFYCIVFSSKQEGCPTGYILRNKKEYVYKEKKAKETKISGFLEAMIAFLLRSVYNQREFPFEGGDAA